MDSSSFKMDAVDAADQFMTNNTLTGIVRYIQYLFDISSLQGVCTHMTKVHGEYFLYN